MTKQTTRQTTDYITAGKKKDLEAELKDLKGPKRKEILDALAYAKSLGDLSENAEYHNAREDQAKLEEKIKKIEYILQNAEVVVPTGGDVVGIGSKVTVEKEGDKEKKVYVMVGSEESDMAEGKISNRSPLGEALFGKKKGDVAIFQTPRGKVNYKIVDVS